MFSGFGGGKKPVKQEMVQVERSDSTSPFWRTRSNEKARNSSDKKSERDPNMVVGASYSYADMMTLDLLSLGSGSARPRTPPGHSRKESKNRNTPPVTKGVVSPPRKNYSDFLSSTNNDWDTNEEDDEYGYEEGEENFGIPRRPSTRRKSKRIEQSAIDPGGTFALSSPGITPWTAPPLQPQKPPSARRYSNSADIAIERPTPSYPAPKKSEGKILRPQYKDILQDPANSLHLIHHPPLPSDATQKEIDANSQRINRINKFKTLLQATNINLTELRAQAWNGVPEELRAMTWQLLLGYLPTSSEQRVATLERRRKEYLDGIKETFERIGGAGAASSKGSKSKGLDEAIWHQISIDVPRTNPHIELYGYEATERSLERILYLWAIRHPASGYVQGINDLATPFFQVFLAAYITSNDIGTGMDPGQLPKPVLDAVEADTFWCLTKMLDGIQDNYIVAQPGIVRQVKELRELTSRIDAPLVKKMDSEGIEFMQFSFRWMNCLLMRELSLSNVIRMWDTYLAEEHGFSSFHLYVCAAFLVKWSERLMTMDFQEIMMFLQALPTKDWTEKDLELLLSEAFIWQSLFKGSSAHLKGIETKTEMGGMGGVV